MLTLNVLPMTLLTVTLRLSALSSDHSKCCQKLLNGSLSLVKASHSFTYSCIVSVIRFGCEHIKIYNLNKHSFNFTILHKVRAYEDTLFCVKDRQPITLKQSKLPDELAGVSPNKPLACCPFWQNSFRTSPFQPDGILLRLASCKIVNSSLPSLFSVSSRKERTTIP